METIDSNLTANNISFYYDYKDGQYGYNTSSARGADTFHPFSYMEYNNVIKQSGASNTQTYGPISNGVFIIAPYSLNDGTSGTTQGYGIGTYYFGYIKDKVLNLCWRYSNTGYLPAATPSYDSGTKMITVTTGPYATTTYGFSIRIWTVSR